MTTRNRNARRAANAGAAFENFADGLQRQHVDWHAHQRQRQNRLAAHGVHIGDGVGGGNAAKLKRIVHDRHKEIGGGNQRLLVVEFVDRRVVRGFDAHHQLFGDRHGRDALEDFRQHARRNLAATAATVRQTGETGLGDGAGCRGHFLLSLEVAIIFAGGLSGEVALNGYVHSRVGKRN